MSVRTVLETRNMEGPLNIRPSRRRAWLGLVAILIVLVLVLFVWFTRQSGRLFRYAATEAVVAFIRANDVPRETEARLVAMVRGEAFHDVTVPFVYYLYELYGSSLAAEPDQIAGLAYAEPPATDDPQDAAGLSTLVRNSAALRQHVATALNLFDALFLRVKPDSTGNAVRKRFDEAAYRDIKTILRSAIGEMVTQSDDALSRETDENEYVAALGSLLADDARLTEFVEFSTDFVRELSASWLASFERRQGRKKERLAWVEERLSDEDFDEIVAHARAGSERRMVVQLVVDGLQGKLLEGLVQLSSGDRRGSGARYVAELVERERRSATAASPSGVGDDVIELVREAPIRTDYLENFKKYCFSPAARAVSVSVATVDTPTISVRNLPILKTGSRVAGPFGTGVPNFSYLDRRSGRGWYFWGSDVLYLSDIVRNREDRIPGSEKRPGPGAQTLFERLPHLNTVSCMATLDTGAVEKISAEVGLAVGELERNFIEKTIVLRFRQRARIERELNKRRRWLMDWDAENDRTELRRFRQHARYLAEHEDEGIPDYVLWYNPWPDHFAHSKGPYSDAIIGYEGEYDRLDFYFGKMVEIYQSVKTADGSSSYVDRTLFGVVSDHGLVHTSRRVKTDELLFEAMEADDIQMKYLKLTHDEGELPAIHGRDRITPTRPFDAVVGSTAGGSYIIDLFSIDGLNGDDAAWQRHPDYHELRQHQLLSGKTVDWIQLLKHYLGDTMDLAVVREYGPDAETPWPDDVESVVRVITSDRGEARIYRIRHRDPGGDERVRYRYELLDERDPLGLVDSIRGYLVPSPGPSEEEVRAAIKRCISSSEGCEDHEWQTLLSCTLRPDTVFQLSHLYDSARAGTVNVFPAHHVGMNSEVPGRHAGESFGEKNGTQLYFGGKLERAHIQTARNGSLPVTLYHWLVGDAAFAKIDPDVGVAPRDQFGYRSLLGEPAFAPIR